MREEESGREIAVFTKYRNSSGDELAAEVIAAPGGRAGRHRCERWTYRATRDLTEKLPGFTCSPKQDPSVVIGGVR
jgi:hypothetical protein